MLDSTRHAFAGTILYNSGHVSGCGSAPGIPPQYIRKNEAYIAFSNVHSNPELPPGYGPTANILYNARLVWSTKNYAVAGFKNQVDQADRFVINCANLSVDDTADVTPRRLQQFHPVPGIRYIMQNTSPDSATVYQQDTVTADTFGLLTFRGMFVKKAGSRLVIIPLSSGIEDGPEASAAGQILCSPNPFNPSIHIRLRTMLAVNAPVSLRIYSITGRLVADLSTQFSESKKKTVTWNAEHMASGIYVVKVSAGNRTSLKRVFLVR
jgi:hypothetical protein